MQGRYKRLGIKLKNPIFTADTAYANEVNMKYVHENNINGFIPDNKFRQCDPKFSKKINLTKNDVLLLFIVAYGVMAFFSSRVRRFYNKYSFYFILYIFI